MQTDMDRLLLAAKELKGIDSAAALARYLEISDQVLTNWKARGLPRQSLLALADKIGCNVYWLRDGSGIMKTIYAEDDEQVHTLRAMQKMSKENERYIVITSEAILNASTTKEIKDDVGQLTEKRKVADTLPPRLPGAENRRKQPLSPNPARRIGEINYEGSLDWDYDSQDESEKLRKSEE